MTTEGIFRIDYAIKWAYFINVTLDTPDILLLFLLESFVHFYCWIWSFSTVFVLSNVCFLEFVPLCGLGGLGWQYIEKKFLNFSHSSPTTKLFKN